MPQVDEGKLKLESDEPKKESIWLSLLPTLIMIGIMVVFFILIMNQSGGGGKAMSFGKSRAKLQKDGDLKKITFKDGDVLEEEQEEIEARKLRGSYCFVSRFSVSATMCFIKVFCSLGLPIVNAFENPTFSASRRKILTHKA